MHEQGQEARRTGQEARRAGQEARRAGQEARRADPRRRAVIEVLAACSALWRPPSDGQSAETTLRLWLLLLDDLSEIQIRRGALALLREPRDFFPVPGHLIECALGRTIKIPEYQTDHHGAFVLRCGERLVKQWHTLRVPWRAEIDPGAYDWSRHDELLALWRDFQPALGSEIQPRLKTQHGAAQAGQ